MKIFEYVDSEDYGQDAGATYLEAYDDNEPSSLPSNVRQSVPLLTRKTPTWEDYYESLAGCDR